VILATPTGSESRWSPPGGLPAFAQGQRSYYTAPIKALCREVLRLCKAFGSSNVGMLTGDASVYPTAPIICCTAEVLANIALRDGSRAHAGLS